MPKYIYEILVRQQPSEPGGLGEWRGLGTHANVPDTELFNLLNFMGQQGWEVITIGDIGFGSSQDILLKRELQEGEAVPEQPAPGPIKGVV